MKIEKLKRAVSKSSPEILMGLGIVGMLSSVVHAVKATPKAIELIDDEETALNRDLNGWEKAKVAWKPYVSSAIYFSLSTACIIGAHRVNVKRNAVLATACTLSEKALSDFKVYRGKVAERFGADVERDIRNDVVAERARRDDIPKPDVIIASKGDTLCYDVISGRYFKSDIDKLQKVENIINKRMMNDMYCSLNDFYEELNLKSTDIGDDLGWHIDDGLIELYFSAQLSDDGDPYVVVNYSEPPKYGYSKL